MPCPSVAGFVSIAEKKYGCRLVKHFVSWDGERKKVFFLEKKTDVRCRFPLIGYPENEDDILAPETVQAMCRKLKIPLKEWLG